MGVGVVAAVGVGLVLQDKGDDKGGVWENLERGL